MKIVYISYSIVPSRSANSIHVMQMCQAMALNGHQVVLLVPDKKSEWEKGIDDPYDFYGVKKCFEIKKVFCRSPKGKCLVFCMAAVFIAKKMKPDFVYTRHAAGSYFSSLFNISNIFESHEPLNNILERFFFRATSRRRPMKRFIVVSEALKKHYIEKYPWIENRISVFTDAAGPIGAGVEPVDIHNPEKRFLVGYAGHLYKGRGIEIISRLAELCPWAVFHIIGGMPDDISHWQKRLSPFNNIVICGYVPHKEIYRYLLSFDALIAPYQEQVSVYGGKKKAGGSRDTAKWMSPLKIFEYMAAGKAIVASDLPVLREVLKHEFNALFVSPDNADAWEKALSRLKGFPELREQLGAQARNDIEKKYNWRQRAKNIFISHENSINK